MIGIFLKLTFFPLAILFVIVMRLISPFVLIRYSCIQTTRLGHMSANLELYTLSKNQKLYIPKINFIDIFYPKKYISNIQLYKMIKRRHFCLPFFFMSSVEKINNFIEFFFFTQNKFEIGYGSKFADNAKFKPIIENTKSFEELSKDNFLIKFENVDFKYDNTSKNIFKNLNLEICKNETIGIIGESGIGKSTFIDLLSGLLKPTSGNILFNNININYNIKEYQKNISYIHQKTPVISGSILDNICLGSDATNVDMELLWNILDTAQLREFIIKESDLFKDIGEYGTMISGGQLQRLGIARALYKNTRIIILDEPTSALDDNTEEKFINSLFYKLQNKTIILVSHKYKLVKNCNKIYKVTNQRFKPYLN